MIKLTLQIQPPIFFRSSTLTNKIYVLLKVIFACDLTLAFKMFDSHLLAGLTVPLIYCKINNKFLYKVDPT